MLPMPDDSVIDAIVSRTREDNRLYDEQATEYRKTARAEVDRLSDAIKKNDPSIRKIILFGSILPGRPYRLDSDIDIAIEGGIAATINRIIESSSFKIDLVHIEELRTGILERINTEGIILYEAD